MLSSISVFASVLAVAMKQPFENGLPEGQANPFASPTSMAVAKSDPAAEMIQSLAQYSRVRRSLQLIYYSIATLAGMLVLLLLVWHVILLIVVLVGGGIMPFDVFNNDRANRTNLLSDNAQLLLGLVWGLATFGIALTVLLKSLAMLTIGIEELEVKPDACHT